MYPVEKAWRSRPARSSQKAGATALSSEPRVNRRFPQKKTGLLPYASSLTRGGELRWAGACGTRPGRESPQPFNEMDRREGPTGP